MKTHNNWYHSCNLVTILGKKEDTLQSMLQITMGQVSYLDLKFNWPVYLKLQKDTNLIFLLTVTVALVLLFQKGRNLKNFLGGSGRRLAAHASSTALGVKGLIELFILLPVRYGCTPWLGVKWASFFIMKRVLCVCDGMCNFVQVRWRTCWTYWFHCVGSQMTTWTLHSAACYTWLYTVTGGKINIFFIMNSVVCVCNGLWNFV